MKDCLKRSCPVIHDLLWELIVGCDELCGIELRIENTTDYCQISSSVSLANSTGVFYINETNPTNGSMNMSPHNGSNRIINFSNCIPLDKNDPAGSLANLFTSGSTLKLYIEMCKYSENCSYKPPQERYRLFIFNSFLDILNNMDYDKTNCRLIIRIDANKLQEIPHCLNCCS